MGDSVGYVSSSFCRSHQGFAERTANAETALDGNITIRSVARVWTFPDEISASPISEATPY